jgi:hypothetical protein
MICALLSGASYANNQLWLSDQPPDKKLFKELRRSHGGLVRVEDEVYSKQLWLRKGDGLFKSPYLNSVAGTVHVIDTQQKVIEPAIEQVGNSPSIRFKMPDEGFYNVYYTEQSVDNNMLTVATAKSEVLKHSCKLGHNYDRALVNPNQWTDAPLEVIRLRLPDEDFHTSLQSGIQLQFSVLYKGKPASGAVVKLETQKGWINTTTSNDKGIASFQLVQDNFPDEEKDEVEAAYDTSKPEAKAPEQSKGDEHAGHHGQHGEGKYASMQSDNFLLNVEYTVPETGELNGKPYKEALYTLSMAANYKPNTQGMKLKTQGLMYGSAGFLTLGVGTALYRRRRIKPFREVGFDEN